MTRQFQKPSQDEGQEVSQPKFKLGVGRVCSKSNKLNKIQHMQWSESIGKY